MNELPKIGYKDPETGKIVWLGTITALSASGWLPPDVARIKERVDAAHRQAVSDVAAEQWRRKRALNEAQQTILEFLAKSPNGTTAREIKVYRPEGPGANQITPILETLEKCGMAFHNGKKGKAIRWFISEPGRQYLADLKKTWEVTQE